MKSDFINIRSVYYFDCTDNYKCIENSFKIIQLNIPLYDKTACFYKQFIKKHNNAEEQHAKVFVLPDGHSDKRTGMKIL